MILATARRLQAEACFRQQAVPSTEDATAGERMVSICSRNMLPVEARAVERAEWACGACLLYMLLCSSWSHSVPMWELLVPQGDRMCPAAH